MKPRFDHTKRIRDLILSGMTPAEIACRSREYNLQNYNRRAIEKVARAYLKMFREEGVL